MIEIHFPRQTIVVLNRFLSIVLTICDKRNHRYQQHNSCFINIFIHYSCFNASIGLSRAAKIAGIIPATVPDIISIISAAVIIE